MMIRCGGQQMGYLAAVTDITWSSQRNVPGVDSNRGGGLWSMSWTMPTLSPNFTHPSLVGRQLVELFDGPVRRGMGVLSGRDGQTFTATGLCQEPGRFPALKASGGGVVPCTVPDDAWDYAVTQGLLCKRTASISSVPVTVSDSSGTDAGAPVMLDELLDAACGLNGNTWWIDADGVFQIGPLATTPKWALLPGASIGQTADDGYMSTIVARYISNYTGSPSITPVYSYVSVSNPTTAANLGTAFSYVDLSPLGLKGASQIKALIGQQLAADGARWSLTEQIPVTAYHFTTIGGASASPKLVEAGDMVRVYGVQDTTSSSLGFSLHMDTVLSTVDHPDPTTTATLTPRGFVARDLLGTLTTLISAVQDKSSTSLVG